MKDLTQPYLRPRAAAKYLGIAEQTLAKWRVQGGRLRFRRLGRVVLYAIADLDEALERAVTSTTEADSVDREVAVTTANSSTVRGRSTDVAPLRRHA